MIITYKKFLIREESDSNTVLAEMVTVEERESFGVNAKKTGKTREDEKIHGFYGNVETALIGLVRLLSTRDEKTVTLKEYIAEIKKIKEDILNLSV